jgi:hypothetical protein
MATCNQRKGIPRKTVVLILHLSHQFIQLFRALKVFEAVLEAGPQKVVLRTLSSL